MLKCHTAFVQALLTFCHCENDTLHRTYCYCFHFKYKNFIQTKRIRWICILCCANNEWNILANEGKTQCLIKHWFVVDIIKLCSFLSSSTSFYFGCDGFPEGGCDVRAQSFPLNRFNKENKWRSCNNIYGNRSEIGKLTLCSLGFVYRSRVRFSSTAIDWRVRGKEVREANRKNFSFSIIEAITLQQVCFMHGNKYEDHRRHMNNIHSGRSRKAYM